MTALIAVMERFTYLVVNRDLGDEDAVLDTAATVIHRSFFADAAELPPPTAAQSPTFSPSPFCSCWITVLVIQHAERSIGLGVVDRGRPAGVSPSRPAGPPGRVPKTSLPSALVSRSGSHFRGSPLTWLEAVAPICHPW